MTNYQNEIYALVKDYRDKHEYGTNLVVVEKDEQGNLLPRDEKYYEMLENSIKYNLAHCFQKINDSVFFTPKLVTHRQSFQSSVLNKSDLFSFTFTPREDAEIIFNKMGLDFDKLNLKEDFNDEMSKTKTRKNR